MAKRLEDYSKNELIEFIEAYNLMTQIKKYKYMKKEDLIKEIRDKFDVNDKGQIVSKELSAYPTEYKKKVADIANKPEYTEDDLRQATRQMTNQRTVILKLKDEIAKYDDIDKSTFNYKKLLQEKKNLEDRLKTEKVNLSNIVKIYNKINNIFEEAEKKKEESKKPEYGFKKLNFDKDGLLSDSDYKYALSKKYGLDKLIEDLKEKIDDLPDNKKYDKQKDKLNNELQKLKDERSYFAKIASKHVKRLSEIDNMPSEEEDKSDDIDDLLNKVKDTLHPSMDYLFVGKELVASEKTAKLIKQYVKENFEPPKKNIKAYIIRIDVDKKNNIPLSINCGQITITPKLFIEPKDDDTFQTFTFTKDELKKYGFKMDYIYKMMDAIKNNLISFEKSSISITELMNKINKTKKKEDDKIDDIDNLLENVKKVLQPSMSHLFVGNELVASEKTAKLIKQYVKENYEPPKKNIKGYIILISIDIKDKFPIHINCVQNTITPRLSIGPQGDDASQTFTFTKDELKKYGFKMDYIYKMMDAIKNNLISFEKSSISITELLNKTK